jgi:hypothetical protein
MFLVDVDIPQEGLYSKAITMYCANSSTTNLTLYSNLQQPYPCASIDYIMINCKKRLLKSETRRMTLNVLEGHESPEKNAQKLNPFHLMKRFKRKMLENCIP